MMLPRPRTLCLLLCLPMVLAGLGVLISSANTTGPDTTSVWWLFGHPRNVNTAMGLIGVGMSGALLVIMWNAQTLNRQWLRVAELALKGVAFFVLVILPYVLWSQHVKQQKAENLSDLKRAEAEENQAKQRKDAEQRVTDLLNQMIDLKSAPESRRQAIAVLRPTLRNPSLTSLALAQAVYTIALTDSDPMVREEAWDVLFPNEPMPTDLILKKSLQPRDFVDCLMSYLRDRPVPPVDLIPYKVYVAILANDRDNVDARILAEIEQLRTKTVRNSEKLEASKAAVNRDDGSRPVEDVKNLLIGLIATQPGHAADREPNPQEAPAATQRGASEGSNSGTSRMNAPRTGRGPFSGQADFAAGLTLPLESRQSSPPGASPPPPIQNTRDSPVSVAQAPVLHSLADTDVSSMIKALQSLSPEQRGALLPHVEVYEISEQDTVSTHVETARSAFINAGFIVPKAQTKRERSPQNPKGAIAPRTPEVRYFRLPADAKDAKSDAVRLQKILYAQNFVSAQLDPGNPSENDRIFYGDEALHLHFEVWFPEQKTESPAAARPSTGSSSSH